MNRNTKRKWKQRIFGYLFDLKQGDEQRLASIITNEIEVYVMELNNQIGTQADIIIKLEATINRLQKQLQKG